MMLKHFLDLSDVPAAQLRDVLDIAAAIKAKRVKGQVAAERPLTGKTLAMVFEQPSTRTRVSFDVGMRELGGETLMLTGAEMQLGRGETIADTARVLSRYVDAIMIRMLDHAAVRELARNATVPVINGLTKLSHPCQIMADILTYEEHRGPIKGKIVTWQGDANNVLTSWIEAAQRFDFTMRVASPSELSVAPEVVAWAKDNGARLELGTDALEMADGADCIVTDCWVSMGDKEEHRHNLLRPYQVDGLLMAAAKPDALFMHCLPAHRGEEVTDEVIDGPQSVVFDEAENRLHAQKGVLAWCLGQTSSQISGQAAA
jgi:ornithine carbamoyltransferase